MQQSALSEAYFCPGERHPISPAVHLGRLVGGYPKCRHCPHRAETGSLSARQVNRLRQPQRRGLPHTPFSAEAAAAGTIWNELTTSLVRDWAAAFGLWLRKNCPSDPTPTVLLAADGRPIATAWVAATGEGLRWAGCQTIETGPATAPATAAAVTRFSCHGGVLVGNLTGGAATVAVRCWGPGSRPLSSPGSIDELRPIRESRPSRPARKYGSQTRRSLTGVYLEPFRGHYHGLRPLRFAVQCTSPAMLAYLAELTEITACQSTICTDACPLGDQVRQSHAHFGIRIDEDGERCQVVDEQGRNILPSRLAFPVAAETPSHRPCLALDAAVREATHRKLLDREAELAVDQEGHFWHRFDENHWAPDGLMTLTLLLKRLSRSDAPLSTMLGNP